MVFKKALDIHQQMKSCHLPMNKVCEIGVYRPETCSSSAFINDESHVLLVEADPLCVDELCQVYGKHENVEIIGKAIWDERKILSLFRSDASTFVGELTACPAIVNDKYERDEKDRFEAEGVLFSDIDPGDLDVVLIDVEGAEWNVLSHMKSRPNVVSVEIRASRYQNPNKAKILDWMKRSGYTLWFHSDTDSVFIKNDLKISWSKKIAYALHNAYVSCDQNLQYFKRTLRPR